MLILMSISENLLLPSTKEAPWITPLIELVQKQAERITELEKTNQELKDEIARLKKLPKRPKFRKSGGNSKERSGKVKSSPLNTDLAFRQRSPIKKQEEIKIPPVNIPKGSRFKGYQTYTVQELEIHPKDITYKIEVWETPEGDVIRGKLPDHVQGTHFGADLSSLGPVKYGFLCRSGILLQRFWK